MGIVLRISERGTEDCCICAQTIGDTRNTVQLFVFWPGDEDPTPWMAHESCVVERTLIQRAPQAGRKARRPKRDRVG